MLLIILSWIYISFIFFSFGLGVNELVNRIAKTNDALPVTNNIPATANNSPHIVIVLLQGMVGTTVFASLLSFVMPLGALANGIVLLAALALFFILKERRAAVLAQCRNDFAFTTRLHIIIFIAWIFAVACLSWPISSHHDDGLYYATTTRWIEEYGTVKGLANINPRIGFNSSWFLLQALFSFHYLDLGNFNDLNGLLLLYVFVYILGALNRLYTRDYNLSVIVRALMIVPLSAFHFGASSDFILFNVNYLSSASADLPVCMLLWLVFVWLLELDETPVREHKLSIINIVIVSIFLFIVKPSSAPVLLTIILFFIAAVVKKQWAMAAAMCAIVLLIAGPWIGRNILISGYLIFPFPAIDIINVDWKLPLHHAQWHENAVRVFAINDQYDLGKPFTMQVSEWFPGWFSRLGFIQSLIFIFGCISIVTLLSLFITRGKTYFIRNRYFAFSVIIAIAGAVFWFMKGPDFRLGYGFTGMLTLLALGWMLHYFLDRDIKFAGLLLTAFFIYMLGFYYRNTLKEFVRSAFKPLPARRMPERTEEVKLNNGVTMRIVFNQDSWYAPLPVANDNEYYTIKPVGRGARISDGFKSSEKK